MAKTKKWIQSAVKKPGALHEYLEKKFGLKPDAKITQKLLDKAENATDNKTVLKRINLARTLKHMKHPKHASAGIQAISSRLSDAGVQHVIVIASDA